MREIDRKRERERERGRERESKRERERIPPRKGKTAWPIQKHKRFYGSSLLYMSL